MSIELNQIDHREFQLGQIDIKEYDINADRIIRLPLERPSLEKTVIPTKEKQEILKETGYELTKVIVEPIPDNFIEPSGTLDIADNGNYDVNNYKYVSVNVGGESKFVKLASGQNFELTLDDLKGIDKIISYAFYYLDKMTSVIIPKEVQVINSYAFYSCAGLTKLEFEDGSKLKTIGTNAFYWCSKISDIVFPEGLESIGNNCFTGCSGLQNVVFPTTMKTFVSSCFMNCSALKKVIFKGQSPNITSGCFTNCTSISLYDFRNCTKVPTLANANSLGHAYGCKIVVPDNLYDTWTATSVWSSLTNITWVKASEYVEA